MALNYDKLMAELDKCLGLEASATEEVKATPKSKGALESYDDVEKELLESFDGDEKFGEDEFVFDEEKNSEGTIDETEPEQDEESLFKETVKSYLNKLLEDKSPEEAKEYIGNIFGDAINEVIEPEQTEEPIDREDVEEIAEAASESAEDESSEEEKAYNWFNNTFSDYFNEETGELDDKGLKQAIIKSEFNNDLVFWIWKGLADLDDDGYTYEEFNSLIGSYPGEGNWEKDDWEEFFSADEGKPATGEEKVLESCDKPVEESTGEITETMKQSFIGNFLDEAHEGAYSEGETEWKDPKYEDQAFWDNLVENFFKEGDTSDKFISDLRENGWDEVADYIVEAMNDPETYEGLCLGDDCDTPADEAEEEIDPRCPNKNEASFEAFTSKMIDKYNKYVNGKHYKTSSNSATEGKEEKEIYIDEEQLRRVALEFGYNTRNLRPMVVEAIKGGVI